MPCVWQAWESSRIGSRLKGVDPTRRVTYAGSNGGYLLGANKVADIRGINYLSQFNGKSDASNVGRG
jgi:hypothetical protein